MVQRVLQEPTQLSRRRRVVGLAFLRALGQECSFDLGHNATLRNDDVAKQLVELFIVTDSELEVAWDDALLLVVTCSVAGELENLRSKVLEDSSKVDWRAGSDARGVASFLPEDVGINVSIREACKPTMKDVQATMNAANGKGETSFGRAASLTIASGLVTLTALSSLAASLHEDGSETLASMTTDEEEAGRKRTILMVTPRRFESW